MRPQSAKAKGRRLQQEVRDDVLGTFRELEPDDVRSTSMGASGADLLLSPAARRKFPFHTECKNVESLNMWKAFGQAQDGAAKVYLKAGVVVQPLLVARKNNTAPVAVIPWTYLLSLLGLLDGYRRAGEE